jgi:saccharopine dehydrogenase-like NADP-dependent oxidoreductase
MEHIALFGYGLIGQTVYDYLTDLGYDVDIYDPNVTVPHVNQTDVTANPKILEKLVSAYDGVIAATPYAVNLRIAQAAALVGTAYFDLTEDIGITDAIRLLSNDAIMMPQCGLAPGAVSIITHDLAAKFDTVRDAKIRVGALPRAATNDIRYYLSWSLEGLVNEYMQPCPAIVNGQHVMLQPLEGHELLALDGCEYEAFNTSGGIGTLFDSVKPTRSLTYKSIRYKGHRDRIAFLIDDLQMTQQEVVELFRRDVPYCDDDVVILFVEVTGHIKGRLTTKTYLKKFYSDLKYTAIQKTTAAGAVSVIHCYFRGVLTGHGYVPNEALSFDKFVSNKYGALYEVD